MIKLDVLSDAYILIQFAVMCDFRTKSDVKVVAQGLIKDMDKDVVYCAKLALDQ